MTRVVTRSHQGTGVHAAIIFAVVCAIYLSNGREIGSYDTQPTKYTALELARAGTLRLDSVVAAAPALADRSGFTRDRHGHYRTAYPVLPALIAGGVATALGRSHLVDLRAPLAAPLVAKITASLATAGAVVLAFIAARRSLPPAQAAFVAVGIGLGTNLWATASQTLWQTETVVLALAAVVLVLAVPTHELAATRLWAASLLLGAVGAARPQLAPTIAVLALSILVRRRRASDVVALVPLIVIGGAVAAMNMYWFGHALGAVPRLEALHPRVHGVSGSFGNPLVGGAGLLVSPSRGLLVFSPVILVALAGLSRSRGGRARDDLAWWGAAVLAQFVFYASYSVWWGGHTYGPRYGVDILPLLVPFAIAGLPSVLARRWPRRMACAALAWSVLLAGTGAFVYPHDAWNTSPKEVDTNHERLWDWTDPQFSRCWKAGWSPQNFNLFSMDAVRSRKAS